MRACIIKFEWLFNAAAAARVVKIKNKKICECLRTINLAVVAMKSHSKNILGSIERSANIDGTRDDGGFDTRGYRH